MRCLHIRGGYGLLDVHFSHLSCSPASPVNFLHNLCSAGKPARRGILNAVATPFRG